MSSDHACLLLPTSIGRYNVMNIPLWCAGRHEAPIQSVDMRKQCLSYLCTLFPDVFVYNVGISVERLQTREHTSGWTRPYSCETSRFWTFN